MGTIEIKFSKKPLLVLPESLGRALGLREGDRVEVQRQDRTLQLSRRTQSQHTGSLTDLARIITSTRPVGSVDIEALMDKHGYEQIDDCFAL